MFSKNVIVFDNGKGVNILVESVYSNTSWCPLNYLYYSINVTPCSYKGLFFFRCAKLLDLRSLFQRKDLKF